MAAGVELATAYVSMTVEASRIAPETAKQFGAVEKQADATGKRAGAKMGSGVKSGLGGMLKGIGGLFAGALVGIGVKDFLGDALGEARESQKVGALTTSVIKATGGAAKVSADQVGDLATALSNKTGIDDEVIQSGANMLLTFKNIRNEAGKGNDIFSQSTSVLTDMAAAMGTEPKQAAIQLGKALNDPVKGISALQRVGVTFTEGQKKQIKTLVASGKTMDAQKIILKELNSEFGGAAAAQATAGDKAKVAMGNLKETIGTALLPVVDKMANTFTTKIAPALSGFVTGMQDGTGAGGKFVDILSKVGSFLVSTGRFLLDHKGIIKTVIAAWVAWRLAAIIFNVTQLITLARLKAQTVGTLENTVATKAAAVASKLFAAGQWLVNAALSANPIGIVIGLIVLLVAGIIIAYKKSETFRKIVAGAFEAISAAARFMWNNVVAPVIRFLLDAFVKVTSFYATLLRGLSKVPGFGWAKGAADKLQNVANKAAGIKDAIHDIPSKKDVTVNFKVNGTGQVTLANGVKVDVGQFKARAAGGPVRADEPYIVGEHRPELFVPEQNGRIVPRVPGGGKTDLSESSLQRLAAILAGTPLRANVSPAAFDSAMGWA